MFPTGKEVGFPRDGTSRDKKKILSRCPFVSGQGQEQLSWDKPLCPGTSWDKITFLKKTKTRKKDVLKQEKDVLKQTIWSFYLKNFNSFCPGKSRDRGFCPGTFAPALVPGQRDTGTRKSFCPGTRKSFCPGTKGRRDVETLD